MKSRIVFSLAAASLVACSNEAVVPSQVKSPSEPSLAAEEAPLLPLRGGQPIPGQYIVVLQDNADPVAVSASHTLTPLQTYRHSIRGFAATLSRQQLDVMRRDGAVKYIEQDGLVSALEDAPVTRSFGVPSPPPRSRRKRILRGISIASISPRGSTPTTRTRTTGRG